MQIDRLRMEANRKASKANIESNKDRMSLINAKKKLGEQSTCLFYIIGEGN